MQRLTSPRLQPRADGRRSTPVLVGPPSAARELQARAGEAAGLLKALANADRLMLLCLLVDGERGVSALGALSGLAQPSLSQQLGVLRGERLVATRREGKHVVYRLASPAAMAVLQTLHGLFCAAEPPTPARSRPRAARTTASRQPSSSLKKPS